MSDQNQIDWEKGTIQEPNQIDWDNGQISQPKEKKEKGVKGHLKDIGASLASGAASLPDIAIGVADIYTQGRAGKAIDDSGIYKTGEGQKYWDDKKTDIAKEQEKTRQNIDGILNKTKYVLENPSQITNAIAASVAPMVAGGIAGRMTGIANPVAAGAVGEGLVMAGSQAEQIRQNTDDGLLNNGQEAVALGTGVLGSLFGYAGGRLAQKMGIGDVDTMMVTGRIGPNDIANEIASMPAKSLPRRMIEGAIQEGFLEELPQSVSEQILQNLALDKPWSEGVEDAAVMGTLAGMAMGAGSNILTGNSTETAAPSSTEQQATTPNLPLAPAPSGFNQNDAVVGEYIPRADMPQDNNQHRQGFVYDQQSTEAENLLNFNSANNTDTSSYSDQPSPTSGGNYFTSPQRPSEQLGINPNDGPMSSAAALAVDSGLTPTELLTYSTEQEEGQQLSSVPTDYRNFLGESQQVATQPNLLSSLQYQENSKDDAASNNTNTATAPEIETQKLDLNTRIQETQQKFDAETSVAQKAQLRRELTNLNSELNRVEMLQLNEQKKQQIDISANEAATSSGNNLPEPTQAQIEAGNYKKGHIKVHGLDIAVENPRGSTRSGKNPDGSDWSHTMSDHYGYIKKTKGADQEQLDVYVGKNPESERVFIVDQLNQDNDQFDEHKIMLGYQSLEEAEQAYKSNFDSGWKVGPIRSLSKDEFKSWLDNDDTVRPVSEKVQPKSDRIADKKEVVTTATGRSFEVQHKLVEAADLITSNNPNGQINPNYPQELQPRDRTRAASQLQITEIANQLNPFLLGENPNASDGAPIVSVENIVESGNGRSMAITKAYMEGKAEHYRQWLKEQGYNTDGMTAPVLVRERITPMTSAERIAYTGEANQRSTLELSDTEQAKSDAAKLGSILHQFYGGEIDSAQNRNFVKSYVNGIASSNERGSLLGADGVLTQKGLRRIQASLVARAYGDQTLISDLFESSDSNIKAIGGALMDVSGFWANMLEMVDQGVISKDVDITANLLEAVNLIKKARREGRSVFDLMNQSDIFSGEIDQVTQDFLRIFYSGDKLTRARSREKVATALKYYIDNALSTKSGVNLFGENDPTGAEILRTTHEQVRRQETEKQQDIFTSPQSNEPDAGTVGGGRSGRGTSPRSEAAQEQPESSKVLKKTAPTSEKETIQDFGEKIGGARKDTSVKTGPKTSSTTTKDNRPTWAKRFEITEIAASSNPNEVGKWIITDTRKKDWKGNAKQLGKQFFDSQKDAELALPILAVAQKHRVWAAGKDSFSIYREISDRKRVKVVEQEFQTREDAMKYMAIHAIEILETNTTFGEIDLPRPENTVRKGLDRRKGDAKDADFIRVFGFRGVEFGNWNNQAERQELLNDAFDGLMDLTEILNIPPAAISLNGELALAFGARGQGLSGAKAHYEPERAVINLTKLNGAGSLAHEWWHALDHYFGRQDGKAPSEWVTNADGSRSLKIAKHFEDMSVTSGFSYKSNVREDVQEAYKQLVQTIFRKSENYIDDTVKVESFVSSARNNLKDQLDKLRADLNRELDPKYYKRFNKAASAEQLAEFDTVAELLLTGTALTTEIRHNNNKNSRNIFSGARWSNDALDKLSVIYKSVRGRSGFNAEQKGVLDRLRQYMNTYAQRLKLLAEAQNGTEKAKMIPTDFAMNAKELDQGRGTDYWITTPEMTARAFQGYVEDKISENSGYSPFLNFGPESAAIFTPWGFKRPFPTGAERKAINEKFDTLVKSLKTEQTESGTKLYSRNKLKPDDERVGTSPMSTTFKPLSVVSGTRRVLSILQHLKLSATQDASVSGRITIKGIGSRAFNVQVISSFDGLPAEIQKDATYQDENGNTQNYDVSGVWHNGTLYVVADQVYGDSGKQLTTFDAYEELLVHEIIGHFGIQQIFGKQYKTKLQQLFNALSGIDGIRKIAKDNGVDMQQYEGAYIQPYTQAAKEEIYTEADVQQALVGELFAFIAQNAKSQPFLRQKLKEVVGYIRQWFRERGFNNFLSRYNDSDLMMFLAEARKAVVDKRYFGKYESSTISKNNNDKLFSRRESTNRTDTSAKQVRDKLIERFGASTINQLEKQGKLNILDTYSEAGIEGFYEKGQVTLIADALTDETIVPTFLHELGGHGGFQNMMTPKQYQDLMRQFDRLISQNNPIALEAKRLAERETNSDIQQLEMLPYLLTLASNTQVKNAIHKGNVKRLIDELISQVKAWLYDRLGVNLNLSPNDMVALAERMIGKAANSNQGSQRLYSRQYFEKNIDDLSERIKQLSVQSVKDKTGYKFTDWLGIGLSGLGRRQLTEIYSRILPQLTIYNELAAQMDADKNDAGAEADTIVREWAKLKDENDLAELMHDATLAKIDPAKPYVPGDNRLKYQELSERFNSLSPEAQKMYKTARNAYGKHYSKVHQAIKERILRSELSNQKKADLLKDMDKNFFGYVKGVYFPLARFGKYVVVARNANGEVESVSRAETMAEAQKIRAELINKFPKWKVDRVILDKEFNASRDAVGRGFMSSLFSEVSNLGLSASEQVEFEDTLSQLYLASMPDLSWAKHGIHRKGTAGFSQDARRAFAQNMFHGAGYLAKLRYGDQLAEQLDEMQKYASDQAKSNKEYHQPTAQRVIDEMNKRHENLMNPKSHPLSSALTSLGFIYYLGLSPAAAMVNLSQTPLVAYPIMGAKWGFDKAANELLKASNDFRKGVEFHKVKWEGSKTDLYKTISSDISKFLSKDEKQAYEDAVARGVIDVTQAHDLAGIAQGEDSGIMWKTRPIMRAASVMFHSAERFNREVTFIAAYRLARQSGEKHDSAFDQAVDATYKGHFDYSSGNRPRIMQGNVAKVLLLFKQFGQNMLYTLARQTYQSIKGETEAERKEARKSLAAILAMHATFAGTLGLPMVGMLLSVASWWEGDDDEPWDAEVALRNYLAEAVGKDTALAITKGLPRGLSPVDLSGRVGINNLLLPDVQEGLEGQRLSESTMAAALGPVAGIFTNVLKGAQEISEGRNLRGVETMLPVFLKNFAKTYRYNEEGVQDKTGVSIIDEVDSMDLLVQGMGFSPSDVRTAYEGKSAIYQFDKRREARRSRLMALWSRAKMMDDQEEMDNIWRDILQFNEKNPSRRISRINLNQSYRNRQRRIDRAEDGIYLSNKRQDARQFGRFAFDE